MKIATVKISGDGYLVNGAMSVPNAEGNRHYEEVQEWIKEGGVLESEFTQAEIDQATIDTANADARTYLTATDWYVTRFVETSVAVPDNVTAQRAESRLAIN